MPQTREHLDILRFLNVRRVLIVVTKRDLLSDAQLPLNLAMIRDDLRGTLAQDAEIAAVSTLTGEGVDELRARLAAILGSLPPRDADAPTYLPIDRVFALPGHGTIVTGTLMQGRIALGDTLALQPAGRKLRIRSIHVFSASREHAAAGERVAVNLPGVERNEIARGDILASPVFEARERFAVRFEPLPSALALLRRRVPVRASLGAAEILGVLLFDSIPTTTRSVDATLVLRTPTVAFPGVRFVVRRLSPKTLLGGGEIVARPGTDDREISGAIDSAQNAILTALHAAGVEGLDLSRIAFAANLREEMASDVLAQLLRANAVLPVARPRAYVTREHAEPLLGHILAHLQEREAREPWALGVTALALSRALALPEQLLLRLLAAFVEEGRIARRAGYFATPQHRAAFTPEQNACFAALLDGDPAQPFVPAVAEAVFSILKVSRVPGLARAFDTLIATGGVVKVGDDLYRAEQIAQIRGRVEAFLRVEGRMTVAQCRDLLGVTRKYAVPLLEWFDARGITMRDGDRRFLRKQSENRETNPA